MDLFVTVIVLVTLGVAGWLIYLGTKSKEFKDTVEDIKEEIEDIEEFIESIPTAAQLKKMTKAKLVELAAELGVEIDSKKKKAEIVEALDSKR